VELAREFARARVAPHAAAWDRSGELPRDIVAALGELGFLGMLASEAHDGLGLDTVTYALALEELACADASVAVTVNIHAAVATSVLARHGTDEQKARWLRPMARGELLAAFALSEPEAGSDAAALRTEAVADGDTWVLSGTKAWVTNGSRADLVIAFARTDTTPGAPSRGLSAFVIPTTASGYAPQPKGDTMGLRALAAVRVDLDRVRLPAVHLVGARGQGFRYAMEALELGRLGTAA